MRPHRTVPPAECLVSDWWNLSAAIRSHSPAKPVLIFVSSRRQTRLTALDLMAYLATEDNPRQWLHHDERQVRSPLPGPRPLSQACPSSGCVL